ncbi:MAG: diacylglycerol kinase family protein [Cyclobacteriaceae bacterium]|nr:diacylglycerol kinase family protein [Cyclobacteriaceae bacterium]
MRLIKSFGYALNGLKIAVKEQVNLTIHICVTVIVVMAGIYIEITTTEWVLLVLTIGLVISLELVNTAIEYLVDLVTPERNPLAGKVKDIAAASVLVSSVMAVIVGLFIFSKYIF